ncbi:small integral membrane protein 30, partial [Protopterus annectens]|uniref:small integral membrane protein 30 n=1 Tax=Protopterus annectens TaxID=7888 RepID=UPI001CFB2AE4
FVVLLLLVPRAEAFDADDAIAIVLGSAIACAGFCACLGWYARKRTSCDKEILSKPALETGSEIK